MLKSLSSRHRAVAFVVLFGLGLCPLSSQAQQLDSPVQLLNPVPVDPPTVAGTPQSYMVELPIRNVKASLIAYWLDPTHQQIPMHLQASNAIGGMASLSSKDEQRLPGNGKGPLGLTLPAGVSKIVAVDPTNSLTAFGTKEGLQALDNLVRTIDVPLRLYEVEAQFLQIASRDLPRLGLDFGPFAKKQNPSYIGSVARVGNIQLSLAQLIKERRVKVLTAPRLTVIDGLNGSLEQTTSTPFIIDEQEAKKRVVQTEQRSSSQVLPGRAYVSTSIGIRTSVAQVKEGWVSLSITPTFNTRTVSVNTTIRDGQFLAIQLSSAKDKQQVIVIVTTRRIRRAGEEE